MKQKISLIIRNAIHYCLVLLNRYVVKWKIWQENEVPGRIER